MKNDLQNATVPVGFYLFKVSNKNTKIQSGTSSKLTIRKPERRRWRRCSVFIVNFEHISHIALVFLLLTFNKQIPDEISYMHFYYLSTYKTTHNCFVNKFSQIDVFLTQTPDKEFQDVFRMD